MPGKAQTTSGQRRDEEISRSSPRFIKIVSEEDGYISITVRDSGTGIGRAQLEKLFVYPDSQPGTGGETGMGLGMTSTKELVEKMKGEIQVKSKEGIGTSVKLTFPSFSRDK